MTHRPPAQPLAAQAQGIKGHPTPQRKTATAAFQTEQQTRLRKAMLIK